MLDFHGSLDIVLHDTDDAGKWFVEARLAWEGML